MVKTNQSQDSSLDEDFDNDYEDPNDTYSDELLDDKVMSSGEAIKDTNAVDRIFNTEVLLENIRRTMLGYKIVRGKYINTGKGIARTETVDKMINSLRAIINTENMLASKDDDEINYILLEKAKENIYRMYDDPMVDEDDVEHVANMLDHPAEMFMGIVKYGEGSESARQILTGNYMRLNEKSEEYNPALRVGTSNFDFFTMGGKRK